MSVDADAELWSVRTRVPCVCVAWQLNMTREEGIRNVTN